MTLRAEVADPAPDPPVPASPLGAPVVRGSAWLVSSVGVSALGGFLFWLIAIRLTDTETVGVASKSFSLLMFANYLTSLGLPVAVARYASGPPRVVRALFRLALVATATSSVVGALVVVVLAPDDMRPLWGGGTGAGWLLFGACLVGISFAVLVDVRLTAMRQWRWVLGRGLAVAVVRLPLLVVADLAEDPLWLFALIGGIPALSGVIGVVVVGRVTAMRPRVPWRPVPEITTEAARYSAVNWLGMLAAQAPQFAMPLVVAAHEPTETFGGFFLAWQITMVIFLVPQSVANLVLVEGARHPDRLGHQLRIGAVIALVITGAVTAVSGLAPRLLELVFTEGYGEAVELLPILVAAAVPWSITSMCLAEARVRADGAAVVAITAAFSCATLLPAFALAAAEGSQGASVAWLGGNVVAALAAATVIGVRRRAGLRQRIASP